MSRVASMTVEPSNPKTFSAQATLTNALSDVNEAESPEQPAQASASKRPNFYRIVERERERRSGDACVAAEPRTFREIPSASTPRSKTWWVARLPFHGEGLIEGYPSEAVARERFAHFSPTEYAEIYLVAPDHSIAEAARVRRVPR